MSEFHEDVSIDPEEVVRTLDDVRSRLRTAIWALHGMHQDVSALTIDDLADLEHMLSETLEQVLTPAVDAVGQILGVAPDGAVPTTH
jgi:ABC-type transporter Mla subunit MlaD